MQHPKEVRELLPYLVQRITSPRAQGRDPFFWWRLDYMGAAEYEWGALPNTLRVMREHEPCAPVEFVGVLDGDTTVSGWYVGPESHRAAAEYWFKHCLSREGAQNDFRCMKELSYLHEAYKKDGHRYVGWWCVDAGEPHSHRDGWWAIFRSRADAQAWCAEVWAGKPMETS